LRVHRATSCDIGYSGREVVPMNYVTYSDLFTFVLIIIALLTYLNNRDNKHKK
jgi:hypothetical protein